MIIRGMLKQTGSVLGGLAMIAIMVTIACVPIFGSMAVFAWSMLVLTDILRWDESESWVLALIIAVAHLWMEFHWILPALKYLGITT